LFKFPDPSLFTKFLIGRDGKVLNRFAPTTKPEDLETEIEKVL